MAIKTITTDIFGLEAKLNELGWSKILQIIPYHRYDGTLFVIIYKEGEI